MHSLIIFASGRGSNAQAIIDYFKKNGGAKVSLIVSNKADAGVLDIAKNEHIPFLIIDKHTINEALLVEQLIDSNPSLIILAGFLWKVPDAVLNAFPGRIINIHPALLPKYGGKGMYGHHVHEAVIAAKEKESGITIHYVNEHYDEGNIITQARCSITGTDTPDSLAYKIHKLEHYFFPRTIEFLLKQL
ncbi:MAG: phosphoribosylglycinamide formyltransferase [Bacteroidetes bacterium]|nr:phosphoribosylglycinamide formyltransferase [Bacteroidota bacterium]